MNLQKSLRWESKKYRDWICTLDCVICGQPGWEDNQIVPHHIHGIGGFSGMGAKAGDNLTMPMHVRCHNYWHSHPDHEAQWAWLVKTQSQAILAIANGTLKL